MAGTFSLHRASARELEYRAPAECPARDEVAARVAQTNGNATAHIEVVRDEVLFRGELVIGEGDARLKRTVSAKTCSAVVDALTLVVSLYREPGETKTETLGSIDDPAPPAAPYPPERPRDHAPPSKPKAPPAPFAFGLATTGASWSDAISTELSGFGELALRRDLWEPSVKLGVGRTFGTTLSNGGSPIVEVVVTAASLEGCPAAVRWNVTRTSLCARGDAGTIVASANGAEESRRWYTAGGILHERIAVYGSVDDTHVFVDLFGGVIAPLARHRFFTTNGVYEVPAVQASFGFGAGVVLP